MAIAHPPAPEDGPLFELDDVPPDDQDAVAEEIRVLMLRRKINQARLARALGMSTASLSERLNGKSNFTVRELYRIARLFRVRVSELFPDDQRGLFDASLFARDLYNSAVLYVTKIEYPLGYAPPVAVQLTLFGGTETSQPDITSIPATTALSTPGTRVTSRKAA